MIEDKLNKILENQELILRLLVQILKDTNRSQFLENYAANLLSTLTEQKLQF